MKQFPSARSLSSSELRWIPPNSLDVLNQRQKYPMILYGGHFFKKAAIDVQDSWRSKFLNVDSVYVCNHSKPYCPCKLVVLNDKSAKIINDHVNDTGHFLDPHLIRRYEFSVFVRKELEKDSDLSPAQMISKYISRKETVIDCFTPDKRYLAGRVSSLKDELFGKIPTELSEIDIEELKAKYPDFQFDEVNYSVGSSNHTAFVIHSPFQDRLARSENSIFLGDGTFKMTPPMFNQVYTMHLVLGPKSFPVCFVLCVNRPKQLYLSLFQFMRDKVGMKPMMLITDFEEACRNAAREIWQNIILKGCFFHYAQALIKNAKERHLGNSYKYNMEVNAIIKAYMALAFVPIEEMSVYHDVIVNRINAINDSQLNSFLLDFDSYFCDTWYNGKFSLNDWNQLGDVVHRSNNWAENFHSCFSKKFSHAHPNLWKFLNKLEDTRKMIEFDYNDLLNNIHLYRDPESSEYTSLLVRTIQKKDELYKGEPMKYLNAISVIPLKIVLRVERDILKENGGDKKRIEEIETYLSDEKEISVLEIEDSLESIDKKRKKFVCVTKMYIRKRRQKMRKLRKELKERKKAEKEEVLLDSKETKEVTVILEKIDKGLSRNMSEKEFETWLNMEENEDGDEDQESDAGQIMEIIEDESETLVLPTPNEDLENHGNLENKSEEFEIPKTNQSLFRMSEEPSLIPKIDQEMQKEVTVISSTSSEVIITGVNHLPKQPSLELIEVKKGPEIVADDHGTVETNEDELTKTIDQVHKEREITKPQKTNNGKKKKRTFLQRMEHQRNRKRKASERKEEKETKEN